MTIKYLIAVCCVFSACMLQGCWKPANQPAEGLLAGAALDAGTNTPVNANVSDRSQVGVDVGARLGALSNAATTADIEIDDKENVDLEGQIKRKKALIAENSRLIDELRKRGAEAYSSRRGVVINLPDILFKFDRAELTPEAERTIAEIADIIKSVTHRPLSVEGHTDAVGNVVYNKQLTLRRAEKVAAELGRQHISRSHMKVAGYGEGRPIATNNTDAGRAKNRRVEIIIENN